MLQINLDPKSSIFHTFLSTVLNSLAIQLELATEKEIGNVTEEVLFYLKVIMPLCPDITVYCITQLLKCLFGTNMVNQYSDFMSILDKNEANNKSSFHQDVMMVNMLSTLKEESRRSSICSNASQKLSLDSKNPRMVAERQLLMTMENFAKNKSDRKWSTNKKELERYIRLFEPVVIQALKVCNIVYCSYENVTVLTSVFGKLILDSAQTTDYPLHTFNAMKIDFYENRLFADSVPQKVCVCEALYGFIVYIDLGVHRFY